MTKLEQAEPLVFMTEGVCRIRQFADGTVEYYDSDGNVTARFDCSSKPIVTNHARFALAIDAKTGDVGIGSVSEPKRPHYCEILEAITALREALAEQTEQEPVACNCGTNPWHDCNESEGCRIKKSLGISSRPVYDQRADHHKMMLGYEIATKYGVFENKAFQLCDEMKKLYAAPVRTKDLTSDELSDLVFDYEPCENPFKFARAVIAAYKEKNNVWHSPSSN